MIQAAVTIFLLFAVIFQLSFYGTGAIHPLSEAHFKQSERLHLIHTDPNIGVHSAIQDNSVFIPKTEALVCGYVHSRLEAGGYRHSDNTSCLSVIGDISDGGSVMKLALSWSFTLSTS